MNGKVLVLGLLTFTVGFSALLYYFQVFAYYHKVDNLSFIKVLNQKVPVKNYQGIDSITSGLKLRGCFAVNKEDFSDLPILSRATPLSAPFWFRCFDHVEIQKALSSGEAKAFLAAVNEKDGIDRVVAVYSDGTAFQWRQLNSKFLD